MNIRFSHISIHGFLSIGDAEVDLSDRGYTLVKGVNHDAEDGAVSNGSGKSSIFSAICYALTGETVQGLKSDIVNIHGDGGCAVILDFSVDGTAYRVARYRTYGKIGTDLKVYVGGEDKSGKGLKESQAILSQYLPDVSSELIGSVILLGQGLPHKFTDNTPSGRKEVLERLSKSDYMIEDIKGRIQRRTDSLNGSKRAFEDDSLKMTERRVLYEGQKSSSETELSEIAKSEDSSQEIERLDAEAKSFRIEADKLSAESLSLDRERQSLNDAMLSSSQHKASELKESYDSFGKRLDDAGMSLASMDARIVSLSDDIKTLESITDICPTCHQRIPGVRKPSTEEQHRELEKLRHERAHTAECISSIKAEREKDQKSITDRYDASDASDGEKLRKLSDRIASTKSQIDTIRESCRRDEAKSSQLRIKDAGRSSEMNKLTKKIAGLDASLAEVDASLKKDADGLKKVSDSLATVSGMMTLAKRDFRGYLLSNVIDFIGRKAKEYSSFIFGTDGISFMLDGNNIGISYCGKAYENLSGGEKQKVDLIVQFSIRDMLCQYLGFSSNILCLDEIFDNLDSVGCTKVINLISAKLNDIESIFIISHHADELAIPYDRMLVIEKDSRGVSSIIRE